MERLAVRILGRMAARCVDGLRGNATALRQPNKQEKNDAESSHKSPMTARNATTANAEKATSPMPSLKEPVNNETRPQINEKSTKPAVTKKP